MNKQIELDNIKDEIIKNNVASNLARTASNLVIGEGNLNAKIMFVGEAPGKMEDQTGKPFQGIAGQNLDEQLIKNKLSRDDIFITNPVMYRPINGNKNRKPTDTEIADFAPYFERVVALVDPEIIVTLGQTSTDKFIESDETISKIHGQPIEVEFAGKTRKVVPIYHPSPLVMNTDLQKKADFAEDIEKIKNL